MQTLNAIKKLEKAGFRIELAKGCGLVDFNKRYIAIHPELAHYIEIMTQDDVDGNGIVAVIDLRRPGQEDNPYTDYHAGTFCRNIAQAIRFAQNW